MKSKSALQSLSINVILKALIKGGRYFCGSRYEIFYPSETLCQNNSQYEKCPNTAFFLIRIFPYSD